MQFFVTSDYAMFWKWSVVERDEPKYSCVVEERHSCSYIMTQSLTVSSLVTMRRKIREKMIVVLQKTRRTCSGSGQWLRATWCPGTYGTRSVLTIFGKKETKGELCVYYCSTTSGGENSI